MIKSYIIIIVMSIVFLLFGCNNGETGNSYDAGTDSDGDSITNDASGLNNDVPIEVKSETKTYAVSPSEPNPVTGESAPAFTEKINVVRYYASNPKVPTSAIIIGYPGAVLGAGSYSILAKNLITLSEGAIEFWSYERRENNLEDRIGLDAAQAGSDPDIAGQYYGNGLEIDGHTFSGIIAPDTPTYMSEWGLVQEVNDLNMVLNFIPEEKRKSNVFLLGFSLGSPLISQFAAWDFDGKKASDDLAGLIMLDGGGLRNYLSESNYHNVGCVGSLGLSVGLDELRESGPYIQDLGLGAGMWIAMEIASLKASGNNGDPTEEVSDQFLKDLIGIFLDKPGLRLSARAALGVLADDQYSLALVMRAGLGDITGGPVESYTSMFGDELLRPSDASLLYTWVDFNETSPSELSSLTDMANLISSGPTGALEWYSSVRLNLDVCAVDDLNVSDSGDDYRWDLGLRVIHNAEMDAPVFFFFAEYGEIDDMQYIENYRQSLPPVGDDRPNAGAERDTALPPYLSGFSLVFAPQYHHMDSVLADTNKGMSYLYGPLLDFIMANTAGEVSATLP